MNRNFVHLHNHTHYSVLDGAMTIDAMLSKIHELRMYSVALTDHGNLCGAVEFYLKCMDKGIKPIIGCELYVAPGKLTDKVFDEGTTNYHLTVLAKDEKGYRNLVRLSTIGYAKGFYYKPRVDVETLSEYSEGLIALSGCLKGKVQQLLLNGDIDSAESTANLYREIFGKDNFYIEIMDHGIPEEIKIREYLINLANTCDIPIVVTNDTHYVEKEDVDLQEIVIAIKTGASFSDEKRMRAHPFCHIKSFEEIQESFKEYPDFIKNTVEIAERCNLELDLKTSLMPVFELPPSVTDSFEYLKKLCEEALYKKYAEVTDTVKERLYTELEIIKRMRFVDYFLIVWDFVSFAKSKGIFVGPGRGSAAGSIVAYLLGITNIDPLRYGLLFERFLNPNRVSMPDIDVDFPDTQRDIVIEYTKQKYGWDRVSKIITYGKLLCRSAFKDVSRVMNLSFEEADALTKLIPAELNMTLEKAMQTVPEFREKIASNEKYMKIYDYARKLEGLIRNFSVHAAGVVISRDNLVNHVPLILVNGELVTQYDKDAVEKVGLLKMDFLGLTALTIIHETIKLIEKLKGIKVDINSVKLDDKNVFKMLGSGNTFGVFQLESQGMTEKVVQMKPDSFSDLIALLALYRPGPLKSGMISDYFDYKHKVKEVTYLHPKLAPILSETHGLILYQEQVMKIASELGGFTLAEADDLRKAMGKKIPEVMEKYREKFINGAVKNNVSTEKAEEIFELMANFAEYGFNKAHSTSYAILSYQTAYLKCYYPEIYISCLLSHNINDSTKLKKYIDAACKMGIKIYPLDINESDVFFLPSKGGIRFGFAAVKNVGVSAATKIVEARKKHGKFKDIYHFCEVVDLSVLNKRALESLIKVGAFDNTTGTRRALLEVLEKAISTAQSLKKDQEIGQATFFDLCEEEEFSNRESDIPDLPEFSRTTLQKFEKELFGFYFSGHPLHPYLRILKCAGILSINSLKSKELGSEIVISGVIEEVREKITRTGQKMAFILLEDVSSDCELTVFPKEFERFKEILREGSIVIAKGRLERITPFKILLSELYLIKDYFDSSTTSVFISISESVIKEEILSRLMNIFKENQGNYQVFFELAVEDKLIRISLSPRFKIDLNEEVLEKIFSIINEERVRIRKNEV